MAKRQNPRPQPQVKSLYRLNEDITAPEVRLVGENLTELSEKLGQTITVGVYPIATVLAWAESLAIDLIEISPQAEPPVCRMTDYGKFLYEKKRRDKELKANTVKTVIKEIRFGPETQEHDLEFKVRHAEGFLKEGSKVRAYVQFRGRAINFKERGELLLLRFIQALDDYGTAEAMPKLEGKRMFVFIAPKKKK